MRIVWTQRAVRHLRSVRATIAADSADAADKQVTRIARAIENLVSFPELGRPGRRAGTRELVVGRTPYIIPYRLRGEIIEILAVQHGRQRWPDNF
jgi:plasmid stabilization system protein ParE